MGHWVPMAEHQGGTILAVALSPDFLEDRLAFAASNAGVFRSEDAGKSWKPAGTGVESFAAQSLAFSPHFGRDRTLFAGSVEGSVYRSTDAGESWTALSRLGTGSGVATLSVAPGDGEALVVMAGTLADGVFTSTSRGEEWEARNTGLPDLSVISLVLSPAFASDETAFVATETGLQMTSDGGASWRQVWAGGEEDTIQCVVISPAFATDGTLFVGTERQGVLRSTDRGATWRPANSGLPDLFVYALAISPDFERHKTVVAATSAGIARSRDGGISWRTATGETHIVVSLAASPADSSSDTERILLAGLAGNGVIRSEDGGRIWASVNQGLTATYLVGLVLSPGFGSDGTLFAWGPSDGVFRSSDGGRSWEPAWTWMEGPSVSAFAMSPYFSTDGTLYVGTSRGVSRSEDRGRSWTSFGLEDRAIGLLAASPGPDGGTAVFSVAGSELLWSTDAGANWQALPLPAEDEIPVTLKPVVDEAGENLVLMATWRAPDYSGRGRLRVWSRGLSDTAWNLRFSGNSDTRVAALAVPDSFGRAQKFFIGNGEVAYRIVPDTQERTREGVRPLWAARRVGERDRPVLSLAATPDFAQSHTLIAAAGEGVYVSEDEGMGWRRLGGNLGNRLPLAVTPSPDFSEDQALYALTMGGSLWRWDPEES